MQTFGTLIINLMMNNFTLIVVSLALNFFHKQFIHEGSSPPSFPFRKIKSEITKPH